MRIDFTVYCNVIIKSILFFIIALIAGHLAESVIFGLTLNTVVGSMWRDGYESNAVALITVYAIIIQIVFCIVYTVINTRSVTFRDEMKAEIKNKTPVFDVFKKVYLKNSVFEIPVYIIFLIPYTLFYAFSTVDLANSFSFEKFYIAELWAYIVSGNGFLGLLISVVIMFIILNAVRFIVFLIMRKNLIENSVTLQ